MKVAHRTLLAEVSRHLPPSSAIDFRRGGLTVWDCPPIETGLTLGDLNLDDYNGVRIRCTELELIGTYEEFVHGFIVGDEYPDTTPRAWLRSRLGLSSRSANWAFPVSYGESKLHLMTMLLWVIKCNLPGASWVKGPDFVVVSYGDRRIGYEAGKLLSAYPIKASPLPIGFSGALAQHHLRCGRVSTRIKEFEHVQRKACDSEPGLHMALRILIWSGHNLSDVVRTIHTARAFRDTGSRRVKDLGKNIERLKAHVRSGEKRPLVKIRRELVPYYIDPTQFQQMFGNPYRDGAGARSRGKWLRSLDDVAVLVANRQSGCIATSIRTQRV